MMILQKEACELILQPLIGTEGGEVSEDVRQRKQMVHGTRDYLIPTQAS